MKMPMALALACWAAACPLAWAAAAHAQELDPVVPDGFSALGFVSQGLPPPDRATRLEWSVTRWDGLAALTAGAMAFHGARGAAHVGVALAHAGEDDLGWSTAAVALGGAGASGGAALTAIARRPDTPVDPASLRTTLGVEAGGGAWIDVAPGWRAWASDPGAWNSGVAPPLAPALEIGLEARAPGVRAWAARAASRAGGAHRAGIGMSAGTAGAWLEARDQPLRGSLGVWTAWRGLRLAMRTDAHPVLAPTVRMLVGIGGAPW